MHVPSDKRRKLDAKAIEVTLVGYEPGSKGYQLWDKHTHSVKLSRDVTFDESCFPSQQGAETHPQPSSSIPIPFFLAATAPNPAAEPLSLQAPSLAPSTSSEEDVINMLDPDSRPNTPPIQGPAPPTTPEQNRSLLNSPPNRPSVVRTVILFTLWVHKAVFTLHNIQEVFPSPLCGCMRFDLILETIHKAAREENLAVK